MSAYPEIAERFAKETAEHEMKILHDNGLYRHLRAMNPQDAFSWFDVITVPRTLIYRSAGQSFVFSVSEDPFEFFRRRAGRIHPDYWEEKVVGRPEGVKTYSQDRFNALVAEELQKAEQVFPGVTAAWTETVDGFTAEYNTEYEDEARDALRSFEYLPEGREGEPFRFRDVYGWSFLDFDWWFLRSCHAIVWMISQFDALKATRQAGQGAPTWLDTVRFAVVQSSGAWTTRRVVELLDNAVTAGRARVILNKLTDEGLLIKHGRIGRLWTPPEPHPGGESS